jgi:hypothetical protein
VESAAPAWDRWEAWDRAYLVLVLVGLLVIRACIRDMVIRRGYRGGDILAYRLTHRMVGLARMALAQRMD